MSSLRLVRTVQVSAPLSECTHVSVDSVTPHPRLVQCSSAQPFVCAGGQRSPGVDPKQLAAELQKVSQQQAPGLVGSGIGSGGLGVLSALERSALLHSGTGSAASSGVPSPGQPASPAINKKQRSKVKNLVAGHFKLCSFCVYSEKSLHRRSCDSSDGLISQSFQTNMRRTTVDLELFSGNTEIRTKKPVFPLKTASSEVQQISSWG